MGDDNDGPRDGDRPSEGVVVVGGNDSTKPPSQRQLQADYDSEAALKFLKVVKTLQIIKRVSLMMKQRSKLLDSLQEDYDASQVSMDAVDASHESATETSAALANSEVTPLLATQTSSKRVLDSSQSSDLLNRQASSKRILDATGISIPVDGEEKKITIWGYLYEVVFGKGIVSLFLLAMPLALLSVYREWGPIWVFWTNFFVMIPLAAILGDFTEELALHTNQTIGGLINATFGNAVEVVVAIQALLANEIRVVQSSMLGSILSNLLLVLGCCFLFGGFRYKELTFNSTAASANMGLLALSGIALVLPTPFAEYYELHDEHVLVVSRVAAVFLIFMYVQSLIFQLGTHADIFDDHDEGEAELAAIPFWYAVLFLLIVTLMVTVFSEYLVDSIDGFVAASGISRTFVGIIILPIVGNAVEHVSAVSVAMKNKMDLAMGVAVGSCTQISLFVVPLTVLVGWMTDRDMTLNFPHFEVILFVLSVFTVSIVLSKPKCNWLEGSLLINTYLLIAVGFYFENVKNYDTGK